nr:GTP-binding protein [Acuticoccus mangrovi]
MILTGFLGSGKSTLLRRLLAQPEFAGTGLVINEFGDVAVDHDILAEGRPDVAVTSTGCLCCTAGSDIRVSVAELHEAARTTGRLPLQRVIIETTGLADPAPVINQLVAGAVPAFGLRDHTVARHYRLAGVVTTFDAIHGPQTLARHAECVKQLAFADRVLLTKTDLLDTEDKAQHLAELRRSIARFNPHAPIDDVADPGFSLVDAFAPRPYAPTDLDGDVQEWLDDHGHTHHAHHHHDHDHHHDHGEHDHADHDHEHEHDLNGINSVSVVADRPIDKTAFTVFMDTVSMLYGANMLRMKGIIAFADEPDHPYILQAVQHVVHPLARLDDWPGEDRRSRLVAIVQGLDPTTIEKLFNSVCLRTPADVMGASGLA